MDSKILGACIDFLNLMITERKEFMTSEDSQEFREVLSNEAFIKEFLVIRLQLPRRIGNTSLFIYLLNKYNSYGIVKGINHIDMIKHHDTTRVLQVEDNFSDRLFILSNYKNEIIGRNINTDETPLLLIDTASILSEYRLNKIYETFGNDFIYILLG